MGKTNNWRLTTIREINRRKPASIDPSKHPDETFELYSVPSYESREPEIIQGKEIGSTKQVVEEGDVLICKINPRINRVWVVGKKSKYRQIASSEWIVVGTDGTIMPRFLMYEFSAPFFRNLLQSEVSGVGGSLTRARPKLVENYPFPVAPLPDQKRIVAKLDTLFGHLDQLRTRLDKIPVLLKQFRQAVLTQAVTGKLTEEWRVLPLGDIGEWTGGGTPSKSSTRYWTEGTIPWITPKDMKITFINDSMDKVTSAAVGETNISRIAANSILIVTRSGILRRTLPIGMNTVSATINQDLKAITLKKDIDPKFILYTLVAFERDILDKCMKSGTTVESIESGLLRKYLIRVPPIAVQKRVAAEIENRLAIIHNIEQHFESLTRKIENTPQALLRETFNQGSPLEHTKRKAKSYALEAETLLTAADPDSKVTKSN